MMKRRHPEQTVVPCELNASLPLLALKIIHLQNHRHILNKKNAAQYGYQQFFPYGDRINSYDASYRQTSRIAHKHLGWKSIVPEKTNAAANKRCNKNNKFSRIGNIHDV